MEIEFYENDELISTFGIGDDDEGEFGNFPALEEDETPAEAQEEATFPDYTVVISEPVNELSIRIEVGGEFREVNAKDLFRMLDIVEMAPGSCCS